MKAFILLVCTLAYVGEWLAVPNLMRMATAATHASQKMCCGKSMNCAEDTGCRKPGKEDHGTANCCLDCPMCYTTVLPMAAEQTSPVITIMKLYPVYRSNYIYSYHADAWKPPNNA